MKNDESICAGEVEVRRERRRDLERKKTRSFDFFSKVLAIVRNFFYMESDDVLVKGNY